jgi:hypothetical protein
LTSSKTWGAARKGQLPANGAGNAKTCRKCDLWFLARPYETICDGCVPKNQLVKRLGRSAYGGTSTSAINAHVRTVEKVTQGIVIQRGPSHYSYRDRKQSTELAVKLAQQSARVPELGSYTDHLLAYARSTARGIVPGSIWQQVRLGHRIKPCDGVKTPTLLPHPDQPETLTEAMAA